MASANAREAAAQGAAGRLSVETDSAYVLSTTTPTRGGGEHRGLAGAGQDGAGQTSPVASAAVEAQPSVSGGSSGSGASGPQPQPGAPQLPQEWTGSSGRSSAPQR